MSLKFFVCKLIILWICLSVDSQDKECFTKDKLYNGTVIKSQVEVNTMNCQRACQVQDSCEFFSFRSRSNLEEHKCDLLSDHIGLTDADFSVSGNKLCGGKDCFWPNFKLDGEPHPLNATIEDVFYVQDCRIWCLLINSEPACEFFTYNLEAKTCSLWISKGDESEENGYISGPRVCEETSGLLENSEDQDEQALCLEKNITYEGDSYQKLTTNIRTCKNLCQRDENCEYFSFGAFELPNEGGFNLSCTLFTSKNVSRVEDEYFSSGKKFCYGCFEQGYKLEGNPVGDSFLTTTAEECQSVSASQGKTFFSINLKLSECYIYDIEEPNYTKEKKFVSGPKICPVASTEPSPTTPFVIIRSKSTPKKRPISSSTPAISTDITGSTTISGEGPSTPTSKDTLSTEITDSTTRHVKKNQTTTSKDTPSTEFTGSTTISGEGPSTPTSKDTLSTEITHSTTKRVKKKHTTTSKDTPSTEFTGSTTISGEGPSTPTSKDTLSTEITHSTTKRVKKNHTTTSKDTPSTESTGSTTSSVGSMESTISKRKENPSGFPYCAFEEIYEKENGSFACLFFPTVVGNQNFSESEKNCQQFRSRLPEIRSMRENEDIRARLTKGENIWLGLSDRLTENKYLWQSDQNEAHFTNWVFNQPDHLLDHDCISMHSVYGTWYEMLCDYKENFACEYIYGPYDTLPENEICGAVKDFRLFDVTALIFILIMSFRCINNVHLFL